MFDPNAPFYNPMMGADMANYMGWSPWGALKKKFGKKKRRKSAKRQIAKSPGLLEQIPGVPETARKRLPLGFPVCTLLAASAAAVTVEVSPNVPFRGSRIVAIVSKNVADAAIGVNLNRLDIGSQNQIASGQPIPAEALTPDSIEAMVLMAPARPGLPIQVTYAPTAAPANNITVQTVIYGEAIQ